MVDRHHPGFGDLVSTSRPRHRQQYTAIRAHRKSTARRSLARGRRSGICSYRWRCRLTRHHRSVDRRSIDREPASEAVRLPRSYACRAFTLMRVEFPILEDGNRQAPKIFEPPSFEGWSLESLLSSFWHRLMLTALFSRILSCCRKRALRDKPPLPRRARARQRSQRSRR